MCTSVPLKRSDKLVPLSNLSIYYTWKNIKKSYKDNKFKISAPKWNEKFELVDRSYSVSDIQGYFYHQKKGKSDWQSSSKSVCKSNSK